MPGVENEECAEACVAGVGNGRGRKFGRETARVGEGMVVVMGVGGGGGVGGMLSAV